MDPDYLKPCFSDYGVKKGSSAAPDVASFLEKTDEQSTKQLSSEGYQVFRKCLGKLLWLAQTRHDVKTWLSLVGSVQACPTVAADQALKSILRFLFDDRYVQLRLPSESLELTCQDDRVMTQLNVWSDASHAPYRFNKRKGMTGIVITYMNSLIKTASKTQRAFNCPSLAVPTNANVPIHSMYHSATPEGHSASPGQVEEVRQMRPCGCKCELCDSLCVLQRRGHTTHRCLLHKIP